MRNTFADTVYEIGCADPRIVALVADISPAGSMEKFRNEFPDRFINVGVAEQSLIGIAAGMALRGMRPFVYTIATFSLYRPFEMVRDDLCYQDLPVTVVGMGAGVIYSTLGGTHHTMEDIAVASAIPNMQVIAPCDPEEMRTASHWCAVESQHPVYLRLGKAGEPNLTATAAEPFVFGKLRYLTRGTDVCLLSYGTIMARVVEVADELRRAGLSVSIVSAHTLKPLDREGVATALSSHRVVAVIEEHVPHGGLGSRVKEIAWDTGAQCQLRAYSLRDEFIHLYGTHEELLNAHGLNMPRIASELAALAKT